MRRNIVFLLLVLSTTSWAEGWVTTRDATKLYHRVNGKTVPVDSVPRGTRLKVKQRINEHWYGVTHRGKLVFVPANRVDDPNGDRYPASTSEASFNRNKPTAFSIGPAVGVSSGSGVGLGLGAVGYYNPELIKQPEHRLDFGLNFYYFLSASSSTSGSGSTTTTTVSGSTSWAVQGMGRYGYRLLNWLSLGAEMGFSYMNVSASGSITGTGTGFGVTTASASASKFEFLAGPVAQFNLGRSFSIVASGRFFALPTFHTAFEFRF